MWFIALMKTVHTLHECRLVVNWITKHTVTYFPSMQISFNTSIEANNGCSLLQAWETDCFTALIQTVTVIVIMQASQHKMSTGLWIEYPPDMFMLIEGANYDRITTSSYIVLIIAGNLNRRHFLAID